MAECVPAAPALSQELSPSERSLLVKSLAHTCGFDLVGITSTSSGVFHERYAEQMAAGYGADMDWLFEKPELRQDVQRVHPEARSVISLAVSYASQQPGYLAEPLASDEGWIARYAQGRDYHYDVRKMAIKLAKAMAAHPGLGFDSALHRVFVDTGPLLEKAFAHLAGLGWIGKNTLLINQKRGSWLFLASILTPLELEFDAPSRDHCASCTRCLDACPTSAFPAPYVLDARKCIATWTIETDKPEEVVNPEQLGQHVFGCDICQEVCPWNRRVPESEHPSLLPRAENLRPKLAELAALDEESFKARFPRSAVRRTSAERMTRVIEMIQDAPSKEADLGQA